jgi:hypothetical protein
VIAAVLSVLPGLTAPALPVAEPMKITIQRSGGYAGTVETLCEVDTANLDPVPAAELEQLAVGAEAAAKAAAPAQPIGADFLKYEVTLGDDKDERRWAVVDDNSTSVEPIRRLLNYLAGRGLCGPH